MTKQMITTTLQTTTTTTKIILKQIQTKRNDTQNIARTHNNNKI
jgi:hypothetical protein